MTSIQKTACVLLLTAILIAPLSACNTMEGLGRDAKAAGEAITGAAKDNKGY